MKHPSVPHLLDPHVFLGRVFQGIRMSLVAGNPSGELWRRTYELKDDGIWCYRIGPSGNTEGPLTYEQAYRSVVQTQTTLRGLYA